MKGPKSFGHFVSVLAYIYLMISQFMALYYWWQWAQNHGFWNSLLLGPINGECKGLLWIYFIW
jgi:hypothetical protein